MRFWISASVVIAVGSCRWGRSRQAPPAAAASTAAPSAADIRLWVSRLGSSDYGLRQEATRSLEHAGLRSPFGRRGRRRAGRLGSDDPRGRYSADHAGNRRWRHGRGRRGGSGASGPCSGDFCGPPGRRHFARIPANAAGSGDRGDSSSGRDGRGGERSHHADRLSSSGSRQAVARRSQGLAAAASDRRFGIDQFSQRSAG